MDDLFFGGGATPTGPGPLLGDVDTPSHPSGNEPQEPDDVFPAFDAPGAGGIDVGLPSASGVGPGLAAIPTPMPLQGSELPGIGDASTVRMRGGPRRIRKRTAGDMQNQPPPTASGQLEDRKHIGHVQIRVPAAKRRRLGGDTPRSVGAPSLSSGVSGIMPGLDDGLMDYVDEGDESLGSVFQAGLADMITEGEGEYGEGEGEGEEEGELSELPGEGEETGEGDPAGEGLRQAEGEGEDGGEGAGAGAGAGGGLSGTSTSATPAGLGVGLDGDADADGDGEGSGVAIGEDEEVDDDMPPPASRRMVGVRGLPGVAVPSLLLPSGPGKKSKKTKASVAGKKKSKSNRSRKAASFAPLGHGQVSMRGLAGTKRSPSRVSSRGLLRPTPGAVPLGMGRGRGRGVGRMGPQLEVNGGGFVDPDVRLGDVPDSTRMLSLSVPNSFVQQHQQQTQQRQLQRQQQAASAIGISPSLLPGSAAGIRIDVPIAVPTPLPVVPSAVPQSTQRTVYKTNMGRRPSRPGQTNSFTWRFIRNDSQVQNLLWLLALKNVYGQCLPNMPKDYTTRLVFDRSHVSLIGILNQRKDPSYDELQKRVDGKIMCGITFRPFYEQGYVEIAFVAVSMHLQARGTGRRMMDFVKDWCQRHQVFRMLTCADNNAVQFFAKQGFSKNITLARRRYVGYIKGYSGVTLMECCIRPGVPYLRVRGLIAIQKEEVSRKLRTIQKETHRWDGLQKFPDQFDALRGVPPTATTTKTPRRGRRRKQDGVPMPYPSLLSIPGMAEAGFRPKTFKTAEALSAFLLKIVGRLMELPSAWVLSGISRGVPEFNAEPQEVIDLEEIRKRVKDGVYAKERSPCAEFHRDVCTMLRIAKQRNADALWGLVWRKCLATCEEAYLDILKDAQMYHFFQ